MDQESGSSRKTEGVVNKRRRNQAQRLGSPGAKNQKATRKRRTRRRKNKVGSNAVGRDAEPHKMNSSSGQTEDTCPRQVDPSGPAGVTAQTQTLNLNVTHKETQTAVLVQRTQETKTAKTTTDEISEDSTQNPPDSGSSAGDRGVAPRSMQDPPEAKPAQRNPPEPNPASRPGDKHEDPVSYAKAVSGGKESQSHDSEKTSHQISNRSAEMVPPSGSTIHIHLYALLDKKFNFSPDEDSLVFYTEGQTFSLSLESSCFQKDKSILIQASFSMEDHPLTRGQRFFYQYRVMRHQKEYRESATRGFFIPHNTNIKDVHIYEGFIGRPANYLSNMMSALSLFGPRAEELLECWRSSAAVLLETIFQNWIPSDPRSTERLYNHLQYFLRDLGSAPSRVKYPDSSPPVIKADELVSECLVQILKGELRDQFPRIFSNSNPLILGFLVFRVAARLQISLGIIGFVELCVRVSSEEALQPKILEEFLRYFSNITPHQCLRGSCQCETDPSAPASFSLVLALINRCIQLAVTEVVLLLPLLFAVRQVDAHAAMVGPFVEERNWCGLDGVNFCKFRDLIRHQPDKRERVLRLIKTLVSNVTEPQQLLLISCSALVPFPDLPEYAKLTGIQVEHLIQGLMYRLHRCREEPDLKQAVQNMKATEKTVDQILLMFVNRADCHVCRPSENINHVFKSTVSLLQSACATARLVLMYPGVVCCYQLVLRTAEICAVTEEETSDEDLEPGQLKKDLSQVHQLIQNWRLDLLKKKLLTSSGRLNYPREIQMWDSLMKVECSLDEVTSEWRRGWREDLKKRISQVSDQEQVLLCCLPCLKTIQMSHDGVLSCFYESCRSAIAAVCQRAQEGNLMQTLNSKFRNISQFVVSELLIQSTKRFMHDSVTWLLDRQSVLHILLTTTVDWRTIPVDDAAGAIVHRGVNALGSLLDSLLKGHVTLGDLRTCLKYSEELRRLHQQYKKYPSASSVDLDQVLAQRQRELNSFLQRQQQMDLLIKMITKVSDCVSVPDLRDLEEQHRADISSMPVNNLVLVHYFDKDGKQRALGGPSQVLRYNTSINTLKMATQMLKLKDSNLVLSSWVRKFSDLSSSQSNQLQLTLAQICIHVWTPIMSEFLQLAAAMATANITVGQLQQVLVETGDKGQGGALRRELVMMSEALSESARFDANKNWVEERLAQIDKYLVLRDAAAAADAILTIVEGLRLSGNFSEIRSLRQVREERFQKVALGSIGDFQSHRRLAGMSEPQRFCLEAFVSSLVLVHWVKRNLENQSHVKVFVELACISAGDNSVEIDRVASFHDAVLGYGPLIYSLPPNAGLDQFLFMAARVWEMQRRDDKLADKLIESTRWLDWLKSLKETHGSVEESSLSLAAAIIDRGVFHICCSGQNTQKLRLQNLVHLTLTRDQEVKTLSLDELLELQNKLMLMSSRGEQRHHHVDTFSEVFEGVQRLASILHQMQLSGNFLFRECKLQVQCSPDLLLHIRIVFCPSTGREFHYSGSTMDCIQPLAQTLELCHKDWTSYIQLMRSQFHLMNHFTCQQLVYLSHWLYRVCFRRSPPPQQIWFLLHPVKPQCNLADLRDAYRRAESLVSQLKPDQDDVIMSVVSGEEDLMEFSSEDEDPANSSVVLSKKDETLEEFWGRFRANMPLLLREYLDLLTLAHFLSCLADQNQLQACRRFPAVLQEGKPNLVLCAKTEVLTTVLTLYAFSADLPLPSSDEVMLCSEDTTAEEVELFLRRALGPGCEQSWRKIYCLVNPGLLCYEVGFVLGQLFEELEQRAGPRYRLVIISPVDHQYRYVPSFFSSDKVQMGINPSGAEVRRYLQHHFSQRLVQPVSMDRLSVLVVSSTRPAVGKSLCVKRLAEKEVLERPRAKLITIRLTEPNISVDSFVQTLLEQLALLREQDPVLLHIDTAVVRSGLEEVLFQMLVLGCLSDRYGVLWRKNPAHLIIIEVMRPHRRSDSSQTNGTLLDVLPTIKCHAPKEVEQLLKERSQQTGSHRLIDGTEFSSEGIQRPYQYLKMYRQNQNLDRFDYRAGVTRGSHVDCLTHLLEHCGMQDPSWAELKNFSQFLNVQLKDCENSVYCDPDFLAGQMAGFKGFVVKFMILMARDFASPSLNSSDQSPRLQIDDGLEEEVLAGLTLRKRWETESHPYIFFNADGISMSFLGFHVMVPRGQASLCAVDPISKKVLLGNVMSQKLFQDLQRQRICLTEDFDRLPRSNKLRRISCVVRAEKTDQDFDPDPTYELTADNVMKMLAIHMRMRCGIPVVIMGETGCGKTRLVRFLCELQRHNRPTQNMILVKVHGGTTAEVIYRKVKEAEVLAEQNTRIHKIDTILFFDEANTTEDIFAIKEVLCDRSVRGNPLKMSGLKIIAACNPYRKHSPEMVERLERAGLGYRVKAKETADRIGNVPLRQLVYRVHPLPPSMAALVWDFGQLSDSTEYSYIVQIVLRAMRDHQLPVDCWDTVSKVLSASQKYMRSRQDECSFVSLRDVERSMKVLVWFYKHSQDFFHNHSHLTDSDKTLKCLILAVGVCYYPSLVAKEEYLATICQFFPEPFSSSESLQEEISNCQDFFLKNIRTRETIAKNVALKENVFLMVVCIELRIPLFLVGKPGSSKSLAKTVVADAMQGQNSHCELFKKLKQVHMVSFQCSPHSSPEGIIATFRNCARFQKDKNMDEYVSVVVLDEIGLAEDSPQMPLKTLHPLLEDGSIDDQPDPHMKVGFVGISNWALDPAKMNRGIFVSRWDPSEDELVETAKGICSSSRQILLKIKHLFPSLAKAFLAICEKTSKNQFFGLRDYYSLIKMIFTAVKSSQQEPSDSQLVEAILRNFSGQPKGFDPVSFFHEVLQNQSEIQRPSTLQMVKKNLEHESDQESRYLLLLTTNSAALHTLQQQIFSKGDCAQPEIIFGSGFAKDQEYAHICHNVNRVKTCMETGRTVILLNMQNLYESLYDALNQYYVYLGKQQYVDLGLGSHRVKCRVHTNFRLIVVEDQKKVYEHFPVPLINRLEKHKVDRSTDLQPWQQRVLHKLTEWVKEFTCASLEDFRPSDVFVGFHGDACASALLQALEKKMQENEEKKEQSPTTEATDMAAKPASYQKARDSSSQEYGQEQSENEPVDRSSEEDLETQVLESAKRFLLSTSSPDAVMRLKYSGLAESEREKLQKVYFEQHRQHSLRDFLQDFKDHNLTSTKFLEITTFSSLLTSADIKAIAQLLGLEIDNILLLSLHQFDTEVSFRTKIRGFLPDSDNCHHVLLIQMDLEESHCSNELIATAKYCTMNHVMTLQNRTCWVVFIIKVSRITSQSQYIGFQGGVWHSVHIDDLKDSTDMSPNLLVYCGTLISDLLSTSPSETQEGTGVTKKHGSLHLNSLSLVRSCVQKAVGLLRDPDNVSSRSMQRMHILLKLLSPGQGGTADRFQRLLLDRLSAELKHLEERMSTPRHWVSIQAKKRQALQEGGTLRHTLWRHLQSTITPILASILEVIDRYANLDHLFEEDDRSGLVVMWLDLLGDSHSLDLTPSPSPSGSDQEVLVRHYFMLSGEEERCAAPFSWLIKLLLETLWEESDSIPNLVTDGADERVLRFMSSFCSSALSQHLHKLCDEEQRDFFARFLKDFLLLSMKLNSHEEAQVLYRAMLGCVAELQHLHGVTADFSPAWITAAAKHFAPRLDSLCHLMALQPSMAAAVTLQSSMKAKPEDLMEDIVALGISVEQTKLLTVQSFDECEEFISRVGLLQPCLDQAFAQRYRALCRPAGLQRLDSLWSLWSGLLLVASFIQNVVFNVKDRGEKLKKLSIKHCCLLRSLTQESSDLHSADTLCQLIRILNSFHDESISRDLRFGTSCAVCLSELTDPSTLPCGHTVCLSCIQESVRQQRLSCPTCRKELPNDFQPTITLSVQMSLKQLSDIRGFCNRFFLDVVSRFWLCEGQSPAEGVIEALFSILVSVDGGVYKTRQLTPFLGCVDTSPVVRSVLPKLLLQHSFDEAKIHIQKYLKNLRENLLDPEDHTNLYLLFVNCFQDSLVCSSARARPPSSEEKLRSDTMFLSRLIRKQTADRHQDPAEFLLNIARLKICLNSAAEMIKEVTDKQSKAEVNGGGAMQFFDQVKALCESGLNDWNRIYLLRVLYQCSSQDLVLTVMNEPRWNWIFPPHLMRLQRSSSTFKMDLFLCCGPQYRTLRDALDQVLVRRRSDRFLMEIQNLKGSRVGLLVLVLFSRITSRFRSVDVKVHPSREEVSQLNHLLKSVEAHQVREFCSSLLVNSLGGRSSSLRVVPGLSSQRLKLLELLVHLDAVLLSRNSLLDPLRLIAFQTNSATRFFLPTMPEDRTSEAHQWLAERGTLRLFYCVNGHPCFVGECGRPMVQSRCPDCKAPVGGTNHTPVAGFTENTRGDQTRPGHILGAAASRSEAPERQLTYVQSCVLRMLLHLAMMQGTTQNHQDIGRLIHPEPQDVVSFLWSHLETDLAVLEKSLDQNQDNTALVVHLILNAAHKSAGGPGQQDLTTRMGRNHWEELVCRTAVNPVLGQKLQRLQEAQQVITADDAVCGSPLMTVISGDPAEMLSLPADGPTQCSTFWTLPETLTIEKLCQLVDEADGPNAFPLLTLFLKKIKCVRQLQHLPELAALHSDLIRVFPPSLDPTPHTVVQKIQKIKAEPLRKKLLEMVERFLSVWNFLRSDLVNNAPELGLEVRLCESELTMKSSSELLTPSRTGPGSCLRILVDFLSETHNSLVRESRKSSQNDNSDFSVPLDRISETQLTLCQPERELLPLVLANCHYMLKKGGAMDTFYDLASIQNQMIRRFFAGKPSIKADPARFQNRHQHDFSLVLTEVRKKVPQEPLKGSVGASVRKILRSYTDVCEAVYLLEIGLRFLAKTGGDRELGLKAFLADSLQMRAQISTSVAESLRASRLQHSIFTWQLLTCWKSELMLSRDQDPFQRIPEEFRQKLKGDQRKQLNTFLGLTDVETFSLELHEILLLKTNNVGPDQQYQPHWDIKSTMEEHLEQKDHSPLLGLESFPSEILLGQGTDVWRTAVDFRIK
ncbi:E3 ubiquitin-protein ligase rnf213-beta [Neosynchiropus ocellatus]